MTNDKRSELECGDYITVTLGRAGANAEVVAVDDYGCIVIKFFAPIKIGDDVKEVFK